MPARAEAIERGRSAVRQRAWGAAFQHLSAADREAPLEPEDLEALATAAHLTGRGELRAGLLARAHHQYLSAGARARAVRCAFWVAFGALHEGEHAQAGGWLARAARVLDEAGLDCAERGYLLVAAGVRSFATGDAAAGRAAFEQAAAIGRRFEDADLVALATQGQGRSLIRQGEIVRGLGLLDESMVAVQAGEVSPEVVGGLYCSLLEACGETFDLQRAREWTAALERWCASQADAVPYRGECLMRRAEVLRVHGAWSEALNEAWRAREWFSLPRPRPGLGEALHLLAELHRLRGELAEAEEDYRLASRWEREPRPGYALLRLAQGQVAAARAAIRHAADAVRGQASRPAVLDACVEICLAAHDVPAARAAADELAALAGAIDAPFLHALAARARGAVLLSDGDPRGALAPLRAALSIWRDLSAPYEAARAQALLAQACRADGGCDQADLELAGARSVFEQLGATTDLARIEALARPPDEDGPLTSREKEVLGLVAAGRSNRAIAQELGISEKTVARHLSNMFAKLGVSSRAAATAYAFQHDLV